jgi:hypothetical protein
MEKFIKEIKKVWNELPKEVKVAGYITVSYGLGQALKEITALKIDNTILTFLINLLIVFVEELKRRIDVIRKAK